MDEAARICYFCPDQKFTFIDDWKDHMKTNHPAKRDKNKQLPLTDDQNAYAKEFLLFLKSAGVKKEKVEIEAALPNILITEIYASNDE